MPARLTTATQGVNMVCCDFQKRLQNYNKKIECANKSDKKLIMLA